MKKLALSLLIAVMLAGCNNHYDQRIPADLSKWETELKPHVAKLPEEEQKLFASYAIRVTMTQAFGGKGIPEDMTIGGAIEEERKWIAQKGK